ncbi:hypothetical protein [Streptomyces sp. FH025]|uniref:hypothetical protein n=1 Tax=Streptomyces sp. FH025 TaxID=2815937 RepID=UPI001AA00B50|nr:hypothetical protein [Streptomyces sp. FH025]MBO1416451.1 hypothetical protein [Streptomyces sp. FH025]
MEIDSSSWAATLARVVSSIGGQVKCGPVAVAAGLPPSRAWLCSRERTAHVQRFGSRHGQRLFDVRQNGQRRLNPGRKIKMSDAYASMLP